MHRFIVYQYGKVGSTSVVNALDQLPETEAFQSHFLGEAAFSETFKRLQDPAVSDYVFEHSAGQLIENLRIYRHYLRRGPGGNKLTMISLAREPFDWFRSCITQDIEQHLGALKTQLDKQEIAYAGDAEVVESGMNLVFRRLLHAIAHLGSVDELATQKRFMLNEVLDTADQADFRAFLFFVHMFLRPHVWFRNHFQVLLETDIRDLELLNHGVFCRRQDWGNIYLMRYEELSEGFHFYYVTWALPGILYCHMKISARASCCTANLRQRSQHRWHGNWALCVTPKTPGFWAIKLAIKYSNPDPMSTLKPTA